jgi:hypothetical protein
VRALFFILGALFLGLCAELHAGAAAVASGRHWRISLDSLQCEPAGSVLVIGVQVSYLGPKGPVEAPVSELIDGEGRQIPPKSLVWKDGVKQLARWLPAGGLANVQTERIGDVQLKFDVRDATGELNFAFGDIKAFPLTRKTTKSVCANLLKLDQLQVPHLPPRPAGAETPKVRVYRESYPCVTPQGSRRTLEVNQPPYLPRQLLVFGRGHLPSVRQVELPMGKALAQSYFYAGADELNPVEDAARHAIAGDFPQYSAALVESNSAAAKKYFAFNWGTQKSPIGNELYSVGIYEVRPCAN